MYLVSSVAVVLVAAVGVIVVVQYSLTVQNSVLDTYGHNVLQPIALSQIISCNIMRSWCLWSETPSIHIIVTICFIP